MSRGSTPRHAQTAGDLGFAVQLGANRVGIQWPVQLFVYRLYTTCHGCLEGLGCASISSLMALASSCKALPDDCALCILWLVKN